MTEVVGRADAGWLGVALAAYFVALVGSTWRLAAAVALMVAAAVGMSPRWRMGAMAAGAVAVSSLIFAGDPPHPPLGPVTVQATTVTDPVRYGFQAVSLIAWEDHRVLVESKDQSLPERGTSIEIQGRLVERRGHLRGIPYAGRLMAERVASLGSASLLDGLGNAVRSRVVKQAGPGREGALLAGFLVGDVSRIDPNDMEATRRSGLNHFVAVSGSNVALMMALWMIVLGPLGWGPRRRVVLGLAALVVFATATRFEPSVIRASAMAALVLVGRLAGYTLTGWQALSAAVVAVLIASPEMSLSVGFQLSVAATAGVLVGARVSEVRTVVGRALAITAGAQIAVGPILLATFGSVPLLAPVTNLVAAPLVAASTLTGAVGAMGVAPALPLARSLAGMVLGVAHWGAGWPQVGWLGLGAMSLAASIAMLPRRRHLVALPLAVLAAFSVVGPGADIELPALVVLDVGQGDSMLLLASDGRAALVDGGPDSVDLRSGLGRYGVTRLELVVITHSHADHVTGLEGLFPGISVGEVWERTEPHMGAEGFLELAASHGALLRQPEIGTIARLGDLEIEVLGPRRRYASPNDQSIVLLVTGPSQVALLAGDVEAVAQAELGVIEADILKVPHQGAATSDPVWLSAVSPAVAVIPVGPNDYGHPAPWVVDLLEQLGAEVYRTDENGDVVVPLG